MAATLRENLQRVEVNGDVPPLSPAAAAVIVLDKVDRGSRDVQFHNDILDLVVENLPKSELCLSRIHRAIALRQALLDPVDASQNYLWVGVALLPSHGDDLTVELSLLLAIWYLLHGPIEDEEKRVWLRLDVRPPDKNLRREEVCVFSPELPEEARIPVVALLDEGVVPNCPIQHDAKLLLLPLIHPYVTSSVVAHDGGGGRYSSMVNLCGFDHRGHVLQRALIHGGVFDNNPICEVLRHLLGFVQRHEEGSDQAALATPAGSENEDVGMRRRR
mmetsp:Transcript_562/g.1295  ORF Transcript_562/g.1295 Transcript_562/m.1295 type:complete len:274 (+) Transcript_562:121-942(+)